MNAPLRPVAARSWFEFARQDMLDAWRAFVRSVPADEAAAEIESTSAVMRQIQEVADAGR